MDAFCQTPLLGKHAGRQLRVVCGAAKRTCQLRSRRLRHTKIRESQAVPRLAIPGRQHDCPPVPSPGLLRFPQRMERTPQSQGRLRILRLEFFRCQKVRNCLTRAFQLQKVETKKQIRNEQRLVQPKSFAKRLRRLRIFRGLVLHEPEIAPEFGDIRTDRYGLAIAGRGAAKVAPGLGVVSLGQERFEPGVPIRLRNSQSRSRQGYREYCAHALTSTTSTQIEYRVEEGKPRLFQTPNP